MNTFLKDRLVRRFLSVGGGGGGGDGGAGREAQVTARMNRFVAQTKTDSNNLISAVTALGSELRRDAQNLSQDYLKGISGEEKQALDRLERANNWLSDETNRQSATFATELNTALNDLDAASKTLNLGQRDEVNAQIAAYKSQAEGLDSRFRSDVSTSLDRMDEGAERAIGTFRDESIGLGDVFATAARGSMDEYRRIFDEAGDLSTQRLQKFIQASDTLSQAAIKTRLDMLSVADPRALELSAIADENAAAMMTGRISADMQANLSRSSAMRALQGGFGASSEMGRGLSARDLGLTSLDLQQTGMRDNERNRTLNYNTTLQGFAGMQTNAGALLQNDQTLLQNRGNTLLQAGLGVAENDRNQRQVVFDRTLGARLSNVDTRRNEDISAAQALYNSAAGRERDTLGLSLNNTGAFTELERARAGQRFNTTAGLSSRLFDVGLNTAGTLYGTNVNAASNFYTTNVNSLQNVFGTRMTASQRAVDMRDVAQRQKLSSLTQVRSSAAAMIEQAAEADYQQRMQQQAANNSMWGSIIGTGATIAGGLIGTAVGGPAGGMIGSSLGGMAGQAAAGSLGYGGGQGGAMGTNQGMSSMGAVASILAGSGMSGGPNSSGFFGNQMAAANAYNVAPSALSQQKSTGMGGLFGSGTQGGFYYNPSGVYGR